MFAKIKKKIKELIHKVNGNTTVMEALGVSPVASYGMRKAIALWTSMYENHPYWLSSPTADEPIEVVSIGLPAAIASEKARMATLEFKSEITSKKDDKRAEFLNKSYQKGVIGEIRKQSEYAIAKGGLAITPYPIYTTEKGREKLHHFAFDFTQADRFIPISFDSSGKLTDAAFLILKETADYIYYRLERQTCADGILTISNKAFRREKRSGIDKLSADIYDTIVGDEITLSSVPEWEHLEEEKIIENVDRVLFAYLKMPQANTIDSDSPLGVSGYSRAVDLIKQADIQHARLDWEFKAGLSRIDCDQEAFRDQSNNELKSKDDIPLVFRLRDTGDSTNYNVFAPALRDQSYLAGMDDILTFIEFNCGLSYGTLVPREAGQPRTAYEIKMMRERSYSENADIQKAIQKALEDVVYAMNVHYSLANNTKEALDYQVSFDWDDSIKVDRETALQERLTLMHDGLCGRIENRMWCFGETEGQAIKALNKIDEENKKIAAARINGIGEI